MIYIDSYHDRYEITDMANGGKRGRKCKVLTIQKSMHCSQKAQNIFLTSILPILKYVDRNCRFKEFIDCDFETLANEIVGKFNEICKAMEYYPDWPELSISTSEIRGVDAPVKPFTHRVEGKYSITIDNYGVHVSDLTDMHNEPRTITSGQSNNVAYGKALKAWDKIVKCNTYHEVLNVLNDAGCRLHSYCAND